jgi:hypothetical protein
MIALIDLGARIAAALSLGHTTVMVQYRKQKVTLVVARLDVDRLPMRLQSPF